MLEQFVYFGEAGSVDLAERFADAVAATCELLAKWPGSGEAYEAPPDRMRGLRLFPVQEFEKYLLFYLPSGEGIEVVRVLHQARDVASVFEADESSSA